MLLEAAADVNAADNEVRPHLPTNSAGIANLEGICITHLCAARLEYHILFLSILNASKCDHTMLCEQP